MKRKVNRSGPSTLTISLPSKWAKAQGIDVGDELDVEEQGKSIVIAKEKSSRKIKSITLNLDSFNTLMVNRYLAELYRQGAEEIILKFTKEDIYDYKRGSNTEIDKHLKKLVERFIGMEIVSQAKNRIVLQSLIAEEESGKLDVVQSRIYFLIKDFFDAFIDAMETDFRKFHEKAYDYHDNIAKFTYYYLRLLNFSDLSDEKRSRLFALFMVVDKMMDKVRHTSERLAEIKRATPKIRLFVKEIFCYFLEQFDVIMKKKYTINDVESLIKKRYALVKRVNSEQFTYSELKVISECRILLDTIVDFSETYVALNIEKEDDNQG